MRELQEVSASQVELFLNSVPILSPLTREEKVRLAEALEPKVGSSAELGAAGWWAWLCLCLRKGLHVGCAALQVQCWCAASGAVGHGVDTPGWQAGALASCTAWAPSQQRRQTLKQQLRRWLMLSPCCPLQTFSATSKVVVEGEPGAHFYIVQEGEAVVYQRSSSGNKKINHLFKVAGGAGWAAPLHGATAAAG